MSSGPNIQPPEAYDEINDKIRLAGRRLIDLTGNGPATRGERIRSALGFKPPHPEYRICGQTFLSYGQAGTLTAIAPSKSVASPLRGAGIHTMTDTHTNDFGVDGDLTIFIDRELLGIDLKRAWQPHAPDQVAQKLAKIGRLLCYGDIPHHYHAGDEPRAIISDEATFTDLPHSLIRKSMIVSDLSDDEQCVRFVAPSPFDGPGIEYENIDQVLSPFLADAIATIAPIEIGVAFSEGELRVHRREYSVSIAHINATERMKSVREAMETFETHGWDPDTLYFQARESLAA